nr:hypothetical protein [Tanacetum cinerariifolium]
MALLDNRIESRKDCILGIARGNLAYSMFMFTVYPQYGLRLVTKDLDQVIAFVHEFERSDLMKPSNKVFSITYLVAYALTSSHHSIDYRKKEYIEIDDLFNEIGIVEGSKFAAIKPIDESWAIDIAKNKRLIGEEPSRSSVHTNQEDFQMAKSVLTLIEHKTEDNIQRLIKQAQWNEDLHGIDFFDSVIDVLYTMFVGIDYHSNKDLEINKEQDQARRNLTRVQLINICSLDDYICIYQKNLYKIPLSEHLQWIEAYLMKIPIISEQTIQRWKNEGNVISQNSLAFATRLAKEEITKICDARYKQRNLNPSAKTVVKMLCWTCNEEGHYSNECPKKKQYPDKVKLCTIAVLQGYEPIEDIYEDKQNVFYQEREEINVTDSSSSSDEGYSDVSSE